jgi:hypothetical protein
MMISSKVSKYFSSFVLCITLGACAEIQSSSSPNMQNIRLTALQNCAIGYDLAKQIYDRVVLNETIVVPGRNQSACEKYTLEYLKRSGFIIDEQANIPAMTVTLTAGDEGGVFAVADIGGRVRLGRLYQPAPQGVYPKSGITFFQLPEDAILRRTRQMSRGAQSDQNTEILR